MFWLYNLFLLVTSPIWIPLLIVKAGRRGHKPVWAELQGNFAILPHAEGKRIWIHAVSLGEVMAAKVIVEKLVAMLPDFEVVVTSTTSTGLEAARKHLGQYAVGIFAFPIDIARFQLAALSRVRPAVCVVVETELWLNFLTIAKSMGLRTMVVNGRISTRSFNRSRWIRFFMRAVTAKLDRCLVQTKTDAERFRAYGARSVEVLGNAKFDQAASPPSKTPAEWLEELGLSPSKRVIVVGSTRGEEEERFVLDALSKLDLSSTAVVWAPRHPERATVISEQVAAELCVTPARRSLKEKGDFVLLDTVGELAEVYSIASVAVVGGGFAPHGGQNILQPLALGVSVIHGIHMDNFADIVAQTTASGASIAASSPRELADLIGELLKDEKRRGYMGKAALEFVARNLGASEKYARAIADEARIFKGR